MTPTVREILAAAGCRVVRERDLRELERLGQELARENEMLRARCERLETFITAIRTFGRHDYAVAHLLRSCGLEEE